jgi:hypothetical protein
MRNEEQYFGTYNYESFVRTHEEAKKNNHQYWIDDIPVLNAEMVKFFNEVKYKRRNIVARVDCKKHGGVFEGVGIAYQDAPNFPIGKMFVEYASDGKGKLYCVRSDRIKNEKFRDGSEGYEIKKSKDFTKGVKMALTYLKPFTVAEIMENSNSAYDSGLWRMKSDPTNKLDDAVNIARRRIAEEVDNMIRSGYVPVTQDFKEAILLFQEQGEELKRIANYRPKRIFVWVKPDCVEYQPDTGEPVIAYKLDDVPEDIRNKVAVLQIGEKNHAIMDVGIKITETTYWVFES